MDAFILAGGLSTRMGRDKALVAWNGVPLIERMVSKLSCLNLASVSIAGRRPDLENFAAIVPDQFSARGPLGGMESALRASNEKLSMIIAVDLPLVPVGFLDWMIDRAERTEALVTLPYLEGRPQPLCAVYHRAMLPHIQQALSAGDGKVTRCIEKAATESGMKIDRLSIEGVYAALQPYQQWPLRPGPRHWFRNFNRPEDLEWAALEESV
ncbi:molybdenum cofactor guanylyltransferase [Silvibacterium acidisoli]|uniref:molybdenum cofactor guanylyltransferase n=1 Tax=Acidobacteriaceae bacterium ZG23-2 TaxID=2883246 RepID=UPI00406C7931